VNRIIVCLVTTLIAGCAFKFEVTSQRTALENQVLGSYQELDDDLLMVSSVRAVDKDGKTKTVEMSDLQQRAVEARQNQAFNRDDIDELKSAQILGEQSDGLLSILPAGIGAGEKASSEQRALARLLVEEENRDRQVIWQRIVQSNENLSAKDLPEVRRTFAKSQRDAALPGHWFQEDGGRWRQKALQIESRESADEQDEP